MPVFEITSALGKKIRLTNKQWKHMTQKHAELRSKHADIEDTLAMPDFCCYNAGEDNYEYFRYYSPSPATDK